MDTIFNIFGSHETVKPSTNSIEQRLPANKDALPGKSGTVNPGLSKGKKVLCDVRNQILNTNSENRQDESLKKPLQANFVWKENHGDPGVKSVNVQKSTFQEKPKSFLDNVLTASDKDNSLWPEVETQGFSFWNDDNCDLLFPESERPTFDDFCNSVNIWDKKGSSLALDRSPSPFSIDLKDDLQFCFELPKSFPKPVLEEVAVPLPWEL